MARRVKTLFNNPNERNHRDHRSKKGRKPLSKDSRWLNNQRKQDFLKRKLKRLDDEIKNL